MRQKELTIMKQNPLILSSWNSDLETLDLKIVDFLINLLQNELVVHGGELTLFNYEQVINRKILVKASRFKDIIGSGKNSNELILQSLRKISDTSTILRNFTDTDGKKYKAVVLRLINSIKEFDKSIEAKNIDKREDVFEIEFNDLFLKISTAAFNVQVGNYTKVSLPSSFELKSKYAIKLYQLIKQAEFKDTAFSFNLKELQEYFQVDEKQPFSYIVKFINKFAPEINKLIEFEYKIYKKEKTISFQVLRQPL